MHRAIVAARSAGSVVSHGLLLRIFAVQVVVSDVRVDVPRHSFSPEFYSLSCTQGSLAYPATTAYAECLKPDMER